MVTSKLSETQERKPMEVRVFEEDDDYLKFLIVNTTPSFVNTLRRIMIAEVPTFAIEEVIFLENTTGAFDEYIAHRLGLIPLTSDIEGAEKYYKCECGGVGCSLCSVALELQYETTENEVKIVKSDELISRDPRVTPVSDEIPIIKMGKNQRLKLEAIAKYSIGRDHAKWQPVSQATFQYYADIEIDNADKLPKDISDACPKDVFEYIEHDDIHVLNIANQNNCNLCMLCVNKAEQLAQERLQEAKALEEKDELTDEDKEKIESLKEEAEILKTSLKITGNRNSIVMYIESTGALFVDLIVEKAVERLEERCDTYLEVFDQALTEFNAKINK